MKKRIFLTLTILALAFTQQSFVSAGGKCSGDPEYKKGLTKLDKFKLIKDFRITLGNSKPDKPVTVSYPVSLTAGLRYKFIPVNNPSNKANMVMNLYMNKNAEMLIASTYNPSVDKHYPAIEFECKTSGTLYLFFSFDKGSKGCGVGLFAVSK